MSDGSQNGGEALPAAALHWHPAVVLKYQNDVGVSAGLSATAGALAVVVGRRNRAAGIAAVGAFAVWFVLSLLYKHPIVQVEHIIAVGTGAVIAVRHNDPVLRPVR